MRHPYGQTLQHLPYIGSTELDAHGNPKKSWGPPVPIVDLAVAPTEASEPELGRDAAATSYDVFDPAGTNVRALDKVIYLGDTYQVVGNARRWGINPITGQFGGSQFVIRRVEG